MLISKQINDEFKNSLDNVSKNQKEFKKNFKESLIFF